MTKSVLAIAALAAALSTAAFAADKSTTPTPMTDAQMDAVTAGAQPGDPGYGAQTAIDAGAFKNLPEKFFPPTDVGIQAHQPAGWGRCTASGADHCGPDF